MNPKLQEAGRRGGRVTGQSKVRPLTSDRAKQMARARWQKVKMSPTDNQDATSRPLAGDLSHVSDSGDILTPSENRTP